MHWLAVIIVLPILITAILTADFLLGRHFHKKNFTKRKYPLRTGEIQLITRGTDLFEQYYKDLYNANKSIHILFYIVQKDKFSTLFFNVLTEQAKKGIKVRLLLDWVGSRKVDKSLVKKARAHGVEISFSNVPRLPFLFFSLQQRNHRKITIIDGNLGYLGGFNVGKEYIDLDPVLTPWRDYHLRIKGEGVADLQKEFLVDWERATGNNHLQDQSLFPPLHEGKSAYQIFPSEGIGAEEMLSNHFDQAKKQITIGTPYFIPTPLLIEALERALNRGVIVTVLVPDNSDHPIVKEASFQYLRKILAMGGFVYQYLPGFFHAKVLVIDDAVCDIGTANFDYRSLLLNFELNCFIYDPNFVAKVQEAIKEDISQSKLLQDGDLNNLPFSVRIKEYVGKLIIQLL